MPLKSGKQNIGKNIKTEESNGKGHAQALAIALNVAHQSKVPHAHNRPSGVYKTK